MTPSTSLADVEQAVWVGVHDEQRHSIRPDERLHRYPDDTPWAFARCQRAAWQVSEGRERAAQLWPTCEECASLKAEEAS
ncbi:hypothetical protein BBK82_03070 [Lentzea guizhouensis]|uniref:Uncharacterized protein n=1 Tax=Lentzea guizhouensis TaxID=1586287 RepID=A0A1B2HBU9_9PSEU|nr:hypothetical protein BBK82_03070 [Lentzea guizhouensis]